MGSPLAAVMVLGALFISACTASSQGGSKLAAPPASKGQILSAKKIDNAPASPLPKPSDFVSDPTVALLPSPAGAPSPSPGATAAPPAATALKNTLNNRLGMVSRANFEQGRALLVSQNSASLVARGTGLISNNAGSAIQTTGGSLISNNGGGLISNNSGGLISNNSGGLISNNSGGLISNNSGGLISNNGGGLIAAYRLTQVTQPLISILPLTGEYEFVRREWQVGGGQLLFRRTGDTAGDYYREVILNAKGQAYQQVTNTVRSKHANGAAATQSRSRIDVDERNVLRLKSVHTESYAADDAALRSVAFGPDVSILKYPELGVDLEISAFNLNLTSQTGDFEYHFKNSGLHEKGTLKNVKQDANGFVYYGYGDPLYFYEGQSTVLDQAGNTMFTKTREVVDGVVKRRYELGDGLVLDMVRGADNVYRGSVTQSTKRVGTVAMGILTDGTTVFDVSLDDNPEEVIRIGFGVLDEPTRATPAPSSSPLWYVRTVAGASSGFANGDESQARFSSLRAIVASQTRTGLFFACDAGNNRIVQIEEKDRGWTFTTLVGVPEAGDADGNADTARFRSPWGLAIAPDDTLYVSEFQGHRIRKVSQGEAGVAVSTLMGSNVAEAGLVDGVMPDARLNRPANLYLKGQVLYCVEHGNHTLRAITLDESSQRITTLVGAGTPGETDGSKAEATLTNPVGLCADADGTLLITSATTSSIRRYDPVAATLGTAVAGNQPDWAFRDGPKAQSGLFQPVSIAWLPETGAIIGSRDLRLLGPAGALKTVAGQSNPGVRDGTHDNVFFTSVYGILPLSRHACLVTDSTRIRRLEFLP